MDAFSRHRVLHGEVTQAASLVGKHQQDISQQQEHEAKVSRSMPRRLPHPLIFCGCDRPPLNETDVKSSTGHSAAASGDGAHDAAVHDFDSGNTRGVAGSATQNHVNPYDAMAIAKVVEVVVQRELLGLHQSISERHKELWSRIEQSFSEVKDLCHSSTHSTLRKSHAAPWYGGIPQDPRDIVRFSNGTPEAEASKSFNPKEVRLTADERKRETRFDSRVLHEGSIRSAVSHYKQPNRPAPQRNLTKFRQETWDIARMQRIESYLDADGKLSNIWERFAPQAPPQNCIATFVSGNCFTWIVTSVVIFNCVFIGIDMDSEMRRAFEDASSEQDSIFVNLNLMFTIFFCLELVLRMVGLRTWFIFDDEKAWNLFDTILVVISLVDLSAGDSKGNMGYFRILKVLRMARTLRIFRLFRFFRELRRILMSILAALQSLAWALWFLLLVIYVFAVVLMRAGVDFIKDSATAADRDLFKKFYGSITVCMYMLIQAISGGDDWVQFVEPLDMVSTWYRVVYVFYVLFTVFGVLNVLTGVFMASAAEFMDRDFISQALLIKEQRFVTDLAAIFQEFDSQGSGDLTWDDFSMMVQDPSAQAFLASNGFDINDGPRLFSFCAGQTGAASVDIEALIHGCDRLKGPANNLQTTIMRCEIEELRETISTNLRSLKEEVQRLGRASL